jgi:glutamyl-tRNA reductase
MRPSQNGDDNLMVSPLSTPKMPEILLIGVNHKTAPVELREKLALSSEEIERALERIQQSPHIQEAIIISTCNRVEVLMAVNDRTAAIDAIMDLIAKTKSISHQQLGQSVYHYFGDSAVRHIFRVSSSLDSMMLGEPQILGQVKDAYKSAVKKKSTGVILNRLMHKAFTAAKKIRTETGIGGHAVSISYAAVELAKKIFDSLDDKTVLLVGAGEMAELAVEHLIRNRRSGDILVANRTFSIGLALSGRFGGSAIRLEEIPQYLKTADIIISSTGAPGYVITRDQVKPVMRMRKNRPLFFIDIAVPRDIEPDINRIPNAYVYDIDDLQGVINDNIETRTQESIKAERIIDEAVERFKGWFGNLDTVPTIISLRSKLTAIAEAELAKTVSSLNHLSDQDRQALARMTESLINKILHDPTLFLKNPGAHRNKSVYLDFTRKLFNLDE